MGSLAWFAAKWIGKKIGEKAGLGTAAKTAFFKLTGHNPWEPPPIIIPFAEKIKDLKTDHNLCQSYVADLIKEAKTYKSLYPIKKYLESTRNTIPYNVTRKMLCQIARKLASLKKELVENHADDIAGWLL